MKKLFKRLLPMLPMLTMGMICGLLVGRYGLYAEENGFSAGLFGAIGILFLGFVLGLFLQIAVHEAGHLVFGLMTGYKFCSYRLGNLMLQLEDGRLRLRRMTLVGTGGQCLMAPPPWSEDLPAVLYNLGGCLMNRINRKRKGSVTPGFLWNFGKMLVSGALAALVAYFLYSATEGMGTGMLMTLVRLCIAAIPACVVYLVAGLVLGVEEIRGILRKSS